MDTNSMDRELISARILPFSCQKVFKAWSDPLQIAKWWGPHGFTNSIHNFNFAPGGEWNFTMHGPDGRGYENKIQFKEIKPQEKVVFEHLSDPKFTVRADFDDLGDKTKVTFRMIFESVEQCKAKKKYAIEANEQNFERLQALLGAGFNDYTPNPQLDLVLERTVDVPPHLVWKAWTQESILPKWFCPKPWSISACSIDLRPGGSFNVTMRSPEGQDHPMSGCYLEVVENSKLVWTDTMTGGYRPSDKPFFTAMLLLEPSGGGTKYKAIAIHQNEAHRKQHEEMGFKEGWSICLDQLVACMKEPL